MHISSRAWPTPLLPVITKSTKTGGPQNQPKHQCTSAAFRKEIFSVDRMEARSADTSMPLLRNPFIAVLDTPADMIQTRIMQCVAQPMQPAILSKIAPERRLVRIISAFIVPPPQ